MDKSNKEPSKPRRLSGLSGLSLPVYFLDIDGPKSDKDNCSHSPRKLVQDRRASPPLQSARNQLSSLDSRSLFAALPGDLTRKIHIHPSKAASASFSITFPSHTSIAIFPALVSTSHSFPAKLIFPLHLRKRPSTACSESVNSYRLFLPDQHIRIKFLGTAILSSLFKSLTPDIHPSLSTNIL